MTKKPAPVSGNQPGIKEYLFKRKVVRLPQPPKGWQPVFWWLLFIVYMLVLVVTLIKAY